MSDRDFEITCAHGHWRGEPCGCPLATEDRDGELPKPRARCVGCGRLALLSGSQWDKLRASEEKWYAEQEIAEYERREQDRLPERVREANRRLLTEQAEREMACAMLMAEQDAAQLDIFGGAA